MGMGRTPERRPAPCPGREEEPMKNVRIACGISALLLLLTAAAGPVFGADRYYCIKPDGTPICSITTESAPEDDPSALCNKACIQCSLTCSAAGGPGAMEKYAQSGVPEVPVRSNTSTGAGDYSQPESRAYCRARYEDCRTNCRIDPVNAENDVFLKQCYSWCESVFSGCGKGNREFTGQRGAGW